jgi:copper chaperone
MGGRGWSIEEVVRSGSCAAVPVEEYRGRVYVMDERMTCDHCTHAVSREISLVAGVTGVEVDLGTKLVTVTGEGLDDQQLRAAIEEAGYEASR